MSIKSVIKVKQQKPIKLMSKNKEKLVNDLSSKVQKQLSKVKEGSNIICIASIITTTSETS